MRGACGGRWASSAGSGADEIYKKKNSILTPVDVVTFNSTSPTKNLMVQKKSLNRASISFYSLTRGGAGESSCSQSEGMLQTFIHSDLAAV